MVNSFFLQKSCFLHVSRLSLIHIFSFTDEENGKCGSRFYTSSLTQAEKERRVGNIQFDMLGGLGTEDALVCTMDGEEMCIRDS